MFKKWTEFLFSTVKEEVINLGNKILVLRQRLNDLDDHVLKSFEKNEKRVVDTHTHFERFEGSFSSFVQLIQDKEQAFAELSKRVESLAEMTAEVNRKLRATFKVEELQEHMNRIEEINKNVIDENEFLLLKNRIELLIRLIK